MMKEGEGGKEYDIDSDPGGCVALPATVNTTFCGDDAQAPHPLFMQIYQPCEWLR